LGNVNLIKNNPVTTIFCALWHNYTSNPAAAGFLVMQLKNAVFHAKNNTVLWFTRLFVVRPLVGATGSDANPVFF
jgi:hypothetical protein